MTIEKWHKLQEKGYTLDIVFILDFLYKNQDFDLTGYLSKNPRALAVLSFIKRKNLISATGQLSDEAIKVLEFVNSVTGTLTQKVDNESFQSWCFKAHAAIEDEIRRLTGKKQITQRIKGSSSYSFLCNPVDLYNKLDKINKKYKIPDRERALQVLLSHVKDCHTKNSWFPLMKYFIEKDGSSEFYTKYINFTEDIETEESKPKEIKDLF